MDFRAVHMEDQTETDSVYWYTDGYRSRDPASWTEPEVCRSDSCHTLHHKKLPDNHRCCRNNGISNRRLVIRNDPFPCGIIQSGSCAGDVGM